jgi:hypothetical protein
MRSFRALLFATVLSRAWPAATAADPVPSTRLAAALPDGKWSVHKESYVSGGGVTITVGKVPNWYYYDWSFRNGKAALDALYSEGAQETCSSLYQLDNHSQPRRLDLLFDTEAELGIVKIEGDTMTWVRGPRVPLSEWLKSHGTVAGRPTLFEINKPGGGTTLLVLKRKG